MPVRSTVAAAFALLLPSIAFAQPSGPLDVELDRAYPLRIVLQARPHPVLTPDFRHRLANDVRDALAAGLGPLASIEVIDLDDVPRDKWEPLWQQFADKGFAALDDPRELSGVKTHFLRIEYRDGTYQLEARQHDGFAGLASPLVRKSEVRTPDLASRSAVLLLDKDFGPTGTIEVIDGRKDEVRVRIRGGRLGSLDSYLQVGDVFAVVAIRRLPRAATEPVRTATGKIVQPAPGSTPPPALQPVSRSEAPYDFTYLKVTEAPRDGICMCSVVTRYQDPFRARAGVVAYRCMKFTTTTAPLAIRLVGGDGKPHPTASPFRVWATALRFTTEPGPGDFLDSQAGVFRSSPDKPLSGVACVVVGGAAKAERFPMLVLSPDPVTIKFELNEAAEEKAAYTRACVAVVNRAADARAAQAGCFDGVAKLIEGRRNSDALARATAGFRASDSAATSLSDDIQRLREDAHKSPEAAEMLNRVDQHVQALRDGNSILAARIKDLEAVVKRETGPAADAVVLNAERLNLQIQILMTNGNVDEALAVYEQLVTAVPDSAEIKARRDKLKAEWTPKSAEHAKARDYLFKTWPGLSSLAEYKAGLPEFRAAFEVCKANSDKLGMRKLHASFPAFVAKQNELLQALDPNTDAGKQGFDDAKALTDELVKIEKESAALMK